MKEVFSISSRAIRIWLYPENPSMKDNIKCPAVLSTSISMCEKEKSSLGLALFRSQKSTQTLTLPSFLGTGMTLASHLGYSTTNKKPTLSCFWISSFTYKLHWGCSLLNFCLTSLACGKMGRWCWTIVGSRLGMSSYDHANTSKYDLSRSINLLLSSGDREESILSSLGWSGAPKSINSMLLEMGVTFLSFVSESESHSD